MDGQTSTAAPPFCSPSADVGLRSSDNVDFHVHKALLALASPIFADLFSVPQPPVPCAEDLHPLLNIPLIRLTEDSTTLDALLRLLYPVPDPALRDASQIASVREAAVKYEMGEAMMLMERALREEVEREPLRAYAVACRTGLEDVARAAAAACASAEFVYIPEMDDISAGALYRLLQFRSSRPKNVSEFTFCSPPEVMCRDGAAEGISWSQPSADIILESSDGVPFAAHRLVLTLASPVLARRLKQRAQHDKVSPQGMRMIAIPENSTTLCALLHLCYPLEDPAVPDVRAAYALLQAARKYEMRRAERFARVQWADQVRAQPWDGYFVAMRAGWEEGAREAAGHLAVHAGDRYVREMEDVPADVYRRLLEYRHQCRKVIASVEDRYAGVYSASRHWSDIEGSATEEVGQQRGTATGIAPPLRADTAGPRASGWCLGYRSDGGLPRVLEESQLVQEELKARFAEIEL